MVLPALHEVCLPELGLGPQRIVVAQWYFLPGDEVVSGDRLLQVSAESVSVDVPAPCSGRLVQQLVQVGDWLVASQRLGLILETTPLESTEPS